MLATDVPRKRQLAAVLGSGTRLAVAGTDFVRAVCAVPYLFYPHKKGHLPKFLGAYKT